MRSTTLNDDARRSSNAPDKPRIGLALSGGGFRATAFGLGSMRALHDRGLLNEISVVSGISGGSLLAAMWAYGPATFEEFDASVTDLLRSGLQMELARRVFAPSSGAKKIGSSVRRRFTKKGRAHGQLRSRTDALAEAFASRPFGQRLLDQVTHPDLATVISATDLTTTNAVRFGSRVSSCSRYGDIVNPIRVAEAVAASASFPILLPALDRVYDFRKRDGSVAPERLALTDGGVYDNLGLSVLLPGRVARFTSHVYDLDYVIAIDAGRGRTSKVTGNTTPFRLARSFDITYAKTQDGGRAQLHAAALHGQLRGFVHTYLAMQDRNLPRPVADLVGGDEVVGYPTNFAAMDADDVRRLTTRGEQLTRCLVGYYCPELG